MKINDVRIRLISKEDSKLKAVASIVIDDCFVIHDIKVLEGTQGYFVAMPSRKTPDGQYKDVAHPLNTPTREELNAIVLAEFEKAKNAEGLVNTESTESKEESTDNSEAESK